MGRDEQMENPGTVVRGESAREVGDRGHTGDRPEPAPPAQAETGPGPDPSFDRQAAEAQKGYGRAEIDPAAGTGGGQTARS